jgi:surfeit locus 1 family protein
MPRRNIVSVRFWLPHLAAVLVLIACTRLALWQLDRADEKQTLMDQWETAPALSLSTLDTQAGERFTRVTGRGHFDPDRHILLDNQIRNNHPGVHVFTPFYPDGSDAIIMVNRGWQPWQRRSGQWPQFDTPEGLIEISGRLNQPPRVAVRLGQADALNPDQWPNLMTYFDLDRIEEVFGDGLVPNVVLLDPEHPDHFTADPWQLINMGPEKHRGYAFQWASIGTVVLLIWLVLSVRTFRRS